MQEYVNSILFMLFLIALGMAGLMAEGAEVFAKKAFAPFFSLPRLLTW